MTLFEKQPTVSILVADLAHRLRATPMHKLKDNAFLGSLVGAIVRTARPTNREERELLTKLRDLNRGFVMRAEGGKIVHDLAVTCQQAIPRSKRR